MTTKEATASFLKRANEAFRSGRRDEAISLYEKALEESPFLKAQIEFNLSLAKKRLDSAKHSRTSSKFPVALIIHVFHLDVLEDLRAYAANFPEEGDQYVTYSTDFDADAIHRIKETFPSARLVAVPNVGQDVGALFSLMKLVDLTKYACICKIHTKKGNKKPNEWRKALLRGVLGNKQQVETIIKSFRERPKLMLAGAKQLYLHGPSNLWRNADSIRAIFGELLGNYDFTKTDWGFIGGTCFWIRTEMLVLIERAFSKVELRPTKYVDDGTPAHAAERIFGLLPFVKGYEVLLNDVLDVGRAELTSHFPDDLPREQVSIVPLLEKLWPVTRDNPGSNQRATPNGESSAAPQRSAGNIKGSVEVANNRPEVNGWIAQLGNPAPQEGIVKISGIEIPVIGKTFRSDLKQHGINDGCHAFSFTVPFEVMDGKEHTVQLFDVQTGRLLSEKRCIWDRPKRSYVNFDEFLSSSLTQPFIPAPFTEEDKRCFAIMENIANRLRSYAKDESIKVSVIMPVYNREAVVAASIESVLKQEYSNLELLVVDDGSSDNSVKVIERFTDPRVRLIKLPSNVGHSAARNAGLKAVSGELVAYLDSDNSWDPRYLSVVVGAFRHLQDADAICTGQILYRGDSKVPFAVRYGHLNLALLENNNYLDLNAFVHRKGILKKVIGFDVSLRRFVDYDFIIRTSEAGKLYSVPVILSNYYFDKVANTVTSQSKFSADLGVLHAKLDERVSARLQAMDRRDLDRHVTVVIPSWESLEDIQACISSLRRKNWKGKLEIIVVDNASSPEVLDYLRREKKQGVIQLIENQFNFGFTYAVNQGIAISRKDSDILLLNNDAIAQPGAIQALQEACYKFGDAGMTVPRQILPAGTKTIRVHVPFANERRDADVNLSAHHRNARSIPLFHDGKYIELSYAAFFAVYIQREVVEALGPLDAEYGRHYRSDRIYADLMRHVLRKKIYYVSDAYFIHKLQKATDTLRDKSSKSVAFEYMFNRNQWEPEKAQELGYRQAAWDICT